MQRLLPYLALIPIIALSLIPPSSMGIEAPGPTATIWLILIAAFFGFYTLFLKVNAFVKIACIGGFISCFFSSSPYYSFISYISLVAVCYFYILCTKIKDWTPIFKALQAVMFLNIALLIMQLSGNDKLLNFGLDTINCFGTIGACNQIGGLVNATTALLISFNPFNFIIPLATGIVTKAMGTFLAGVAGILVWLFFINRKLILSIGIVLIIIFAINATAQHDFDNGSGRIPVWKKTIELANRHPITGWGMGSYKYVMNAFMPNWRMAHNSALQVLFEFGYPGLIFIMALFGTLIYKLIQGEGYMCLSGLAMLITDSMVHFPDRQIQVVLIVVLFLAYCTRRITTKGREISYG